MHIGKLHIHTHKVKHALEHVGHKVDTAVEQSGQQVARTEQHVQHTVQTAAEQAQRTAEQLAKDTMNITHLSDDIKHEITSLVDKAADAAKSDLQGVANTVKAEINHTVAVAKSDIESAKAEVIKDLKDSLNAIEKGIEKVEHDFSKEALQKVIHATVKFVRKYPVIPDSFRMAFPGGITIHMGNTEQKLADLDKYAQNPPHGRAQFVDFVRVLSPTGLDIDEKIGVTVPFIETNVGEFGPGASFTSEQIATIIDSLLKTLGVD